MLKVNQVKIDVLKDNNENHLKALARKLNVNISDIISYKIHKQSLDARNKNQIFYVYTFIVTVKNENKVKLNNDINKYEIPKYHFPITGQEILNYRPIIVGAGPAGLFAAYMLAENGYKPLIIERGQMVKQRIKAVQEFWQTGRLNPNSNVQFGEGGAGTFSDGKLNTSVKDDVIHQKVFAIFTENGAPHEITYNYMPHIGTDKLVDIVKNMRNKIIAMGGKFLFDTQMTNIIHENNQIKAIEINYQEIINCEVLILALGHSARDTFKMLYENKLQMEAKPFAVGLRIQHPQQLIDTNQYGEKYQSILHNASYKLTYKCPDKRGVYSFCMCPGGYVVNASSEKGHLAINGMSNYLRDSGIANSAIVISITPSDFGMHPLDGINFQRSLEKKAFDIGQGNIPTQLLKDYENSTISQNFKSIVPCYKGKYTFANLNDLFSQTINNDLKQALKHFDSQIKGFAREDAVLSGIESRTSSPVKIIRDANLESSIKGIYPCGEGAGYAGGITSAAIDGIKIAQAIGKKYSVFTDK